MKTQPAPHPSSQLSSKQGTICAIPETRTSNSDWFLGSAPEELIACFKPCFSNSLTNPRIIGYVVSGPVGAQDLSALILNLEIANEPCGEEFALKAVTALRLRTNAKPEHINDLAAMVALYAGDMAGYPEDVVAGACRSIARSSKWFPSWAELYELLELISNKRRLMLDAAKSFEARNG